MPSATPAPAPVWLHDMTIETGRRQADRDRRRNSTDASKPRSWRWSATRRIRRLQRADPAWRHELAGSIDDPGAVALPAPDPRAVQPGLHVGDACARTSLSSPRSSLCFRPASIRASSPRDAERTARETALLAEIEEQLKSVSSLDEDRILRRFTNLVQATIRTNLWQIGAGRTSAAGDLASSSTRARSRTCRRRARSTRSSSIRRESKAFICASARWRAADCAGPTGRRISAPRSSASSRRSRSRTR